jgi:hypothetical protein
MVEEASETSVSEDGSPYRLHVEPINEGNVLASHLFDVLMDVDSD